MSDKFLKRAFENADVDSVDRFLAKSKIDFEWLMILVAHAICQSLACKNDVNLKGSISFYATTSKHSSLHPLESKSGSLVAR